MSASTVRERQRIAAKTKRLAEEKLAQTVLKTSVSKLDENAKNNALELLASRGLVRGRTDFTGTAKVLISERNWPFQQEWLREKIRQWHMVANNLNSAKKTKRESKVVEEQELLVAEQPAGMPVGTSRLLQLRVRMEELKRR